MSTIQVSLGKPQQVSESSALTLPTKTVDAMKDALEALLAFTKSDKDRNSIIRTGELFFTEMLQNSKVDAGLFDDLVNSRFDALPIDFYEAYAKVLKIDNDPETQFPVDAEAIAKAFKKLSGKVATPLCIKNLTNQINNFTQY